MTRLILGQRIEARQSKDSRVASDDDAPRVTKQMKKRTVITIEKHEVWVIKRPATDEEKQETQKSEPGSESLQGQPEDHPDEDAPHDPEK